MPRAKSIKLTRRLKTRIVKAFKSGKYKQTIGVLYESPNEFATGSYCALGVIGKVCGIADRRLEDRGCLGHIPELRELDDRIGADVIEQNDDEGLSFPQMARWFEENIRTEEELAALRHHK